MDKSEICDRSTIHINNDDKTYTKGDCEIPADLDMNLIYNPQYSVTELTSTKQNAKPRPLNKNPPRPPNSFFLMKNCYMLELRKLGYRFTMPKICKQSKYIWERLPQPVKERYDGLSYKAQIIHQNLYPNYKFSPKPKNPFKNTFPPVGTNKKLEKNISIFSINFCHEPPILSPPLTPPPPSYNYPAPAMNYFSYAIDNNHNDNSITNQSISNDNNCHHNEIYYPHYESYGIRNNHNNDNFYQRYIEGIQNNILH
ncbi:523_t:CDS:2 [Entrophospora sp. SA101]|nr:5671_t:CDS:2 [Entrophospora sp. SA101]CAJ0849868.1 523_t:CDS:2 [Entrophospora sp. SA101]